VKERVIRGRPLGKHALGQLNGGLADGGLARPQLGGVGGGADKLAGARAAGGVDPAGAE